MDIRFSLHDITPPEGFDAILEEKSSVLTSVVPTIIAFELDARMDKHHRTGDVVSLSGTLHVPGVDLRAEEVSTDLLTGLDLLIPKLRRQLMKYRDEHRTSIRAKKSRWSWRTLNPFLSTSTEDSSVSDDGGDLQMVSAPMHAQIVKVLTDTEAMRAVEQSPVDAVIYKAVENGHVRVILKRAPGSYQIIDSNLS